MTNTIGDISDVVINYQITNIVVTLLRLRHKAHMTQQQLSVATGIPRYKISKIETYKTIPDLKTIIILLNYYGARLDVIVPPKSNTANIRK